MRAKADISGFDEFEAALRRAALLADREAEQVLKRGAVNIKKDAQQEARGITYAPHYWRSIGFDMYRTPAGAYAEIGPDKSKRQGPLGHIFEYGIPRTPPHPHLAPALEREVPRFEKALGDLGEELLE